MTDPVYSSDSPGATTDADADAILNGARHMSALETSTREAVLAAVTLSEEDRPTTP